MLRMLEGTIIKAVEINLSCPNLEGEIVSASPKASARFLSAVRKNSSLPIWVKLSPQVSDIGAVAKACENEGADAISLINTFPAMAIDINKMKPVLGNTTGGLSGPAVKPIALKLVWDACRSVQIPVIGMGGIMTGGDAVEFLLAGAAAVSVGTGLFIAPESVTDIIGGIKNFLIKKGCADISMIRGALNEA
jgi:dihydroorotate dehydrogenase (NAD+) catalytic subunit